MRGCIGVLGAWGVVWSIANSGRMGGGSGLRERVCDAVRDSGNWGGIGEKEAGEARCIELAAVYKLGKLPFASPARGREAMLEKCFEWNLNREGRSLGFWSVRTIPFGCPSPALSYLWSVQGSTSAKYSRHTDTYLPPYLAQSLRPNRKQKLQRERTRASLT